MKKKILISLLALCLCFISLFGLVGCKDPLNNPSTLTVTGNGGAVVRVGEYVYFINGYRNVADLVDGDNRKNITQGAIYRVKTGANNSLEFDENGNMQGAEKIADNIAGFNSLNLFVYDNFLYYATPLSLKDKQGNTQFNRTVIKQIGLNGEEDKDLYTTDSTSPISWSVYKIEGNVIIGVLDGEKLVSLNVTTGTTSTIAEGVKSAVFPKVLEYNPQNSGESATKGESQVYYVKDNAIYATNLKTLQGKDTPIFNEGGKEYKVVDYKTKGQEGKVYYTVTEQGSTYYYGTTVTSQGEVLKGTNDTTKYTILTYSDIDFTFNPYDKAIAVYEYKDGDATKKPLMYVLGSETSKISDTEITILAIRNNFVYGFNSNNELVKIGLDAEHNTTVIANFANEKDDNDKEIEDGKNAFYSTGISTDKLNKSLFVDFDGDYMYFFRTFKNNNDEESIYLARVNVNTSKAEVETVGQMEEGHKYTISATTE